MRTCQQTLLGLFLLGTAPVLGQHLYVFSVIETGNPSRPDRLLDARLLHKLTDDVACYGNYTQHWYDFGDRETFTPQTLQSTLKRFQPQSAENDVVWLHYAGRGYSDGPRAWPTLQLNGGDVALRDLLTLLRTKPVRTLLVTVDCGNRQRPLTVVPGDNSRGITDAPHQSSTVAVTPRITRPAQSDVPDMTVVNTYQRLFRATKVRQVIIMASADHGQRALSDPKRGSVWLTALTDAIAGILREQPAEPIWKQVQERVVQFTQKRTRNRQTPLYTRQPITCCETETPY